MTNLSIRCSSNLGFIVVADCREYVFCDYEALERWLADILGAE